MTIKRYSITFWPNSVDLRENPHNGDFVRYTDHLASLRREREPVKVEPLVWETFDAWTHWAKCAVGIYRVKERNGVWKAILDSKDAAHLIYEYTTDGLTPNDYEAAQLAAQADYEARILAALEPDQTALALVAAAYRDAADRCGAHSYSNNYFVSKALHDASTDILARTRADAQAALAAIERAAYERGKAEAQPLIEAGKALAEQAAHVRVGASIPQMDIHASARHLGPLVDAWDAALALLTQDGR